MAEDDGTGRPVYPSVSTTSAGSGSGSGSGSMDLDVSDGVLIDFKSKVDGLLIKLQESPADPQKIAGDGVIPADNLGKNFGESEMLHGAYKKVYEELQNLSKGLAGQIEALGIAVDGSRKGYEAINSDIKRRMQQISRDAEVEYDRYQKAKDPARADAKDEKPADTQGAGDSSGGQG
ncbi:hypothetical protein [Streptomyces sp. SP18CS02]|uniref:hypothetical protein n=1 Tax=Streptomyces sp. SP18CS02 TaxID=3002531 RepID=UPI002E7A28D6|nr:hypothetical protein [Streptomyces sp. SP18CS02]MEE1752258.1 hypothetical protein [Streptomyces sp. SP18CS02]